MADRLGLSVATIDRNERFRRYGLDSARAAAFLRDLESSLGKKLPLTLVWDRPTVASLAAHLLGEDDADSGARGDAAYLDRLANGSSGRGGAEPIAVVGMAGRFPGCPDVDRYWDLLSRGDDAIREVPRARYDIDAVYSPDLGAVGKMATRWGGFIDDVDRFDAQFFGISPREAAEMDPQQRLVLEVAYEALEDAGVIPATLRHSHTGVYMGVLWNDYIAAQRRGDTAHIVEHTATGSHFSIIANRVSYALGLQGPSMAIDTACSSSLVSVHLACQSLSLGESNLALAGGVNLILAPDSTVGMSKFGGMSPDGRCKSFDARGNGYVRADGVGVVVLKRRRDALRDGDRILGLVVGSACNNDGFSNGLTAPNPEAQKSVLREAYARARRATSAVHYIEAHGTGTLLGDPIEAKAIGAILGVDRATDRPLYLGSVKSNFGHAESAAGIAGLIKVLLAIRHRTIPRSLHFETPNPHIPFAELNLRVPTEAVAWPHDDEPALAGVSSFGFGGTNCHVVLEEHRPAAALLAEARAAVVASPAPTRPRVAFVFSGQGAQWPRMGLALAEQEPVFRSALDRCARALANHVSWSLWDELEAPEGRSRLDEADVMQPALFAVGVALARLWESFGVHADVVLGHSMGEIAAAHIAGALDLDDAARIVAHRSRLMKTRSNAGGMVLVGVAAADLHERLRGAEGRLVIGAINGPTTTVVAGPVADLEALLRELDAAGIFARRIRSDVAAHSPDLDGILEPFADAIRDIRPARELIPVVSTVTASRIAGADLGPAHWVNNVRKPVRFLDAVTTALSEERVDVLIEIGPEAILSRALADILGATSSAAIALASMRRGEDARSTLTEAVSALLARGASLALDPQTSTEQPVLVPLSAHAPELLASYAGRTATHLAAHPETRLVDVAYTAAERRTHEPYRATFIARSTAELGSLLASFSVEPSASVPTTRPRIAFVFAGHGSQALGMATRLYLRAPAFRRTLDRCDATLRRFFPFSLVEEIHRPADQSRLDELDVLQCALFAVALAYAETWRAHGIEPEVVLGHSMGEVAAACFTGALSLDDACRVIAERSKLLLAIRGRGAMAFADLTTDQARALVASKAGRICIAGSNSPRSIVFAGDTADIEALITELAARDVFSRRVRIEFASHSPHVEPLLPSLRESLASVRPRAGRVPLLSTVLGTPCTGVELDAVYWAKNLREPVRFGDCVAAALTDGVDTFVEMSAHPVLLQAVEQGAAARGHAVTVVASGRRDSDETITFLGALGQLFTRGASVRWEALRALDARSVALATHPWRDDRHWFEERSPGVDARGAAVTKATRASAADRTGERGVGLDEHPILGAPIDLDVAGAKLAWAGLIAAGTHPSIVDHQIERNVVFAAAAFIDLLLTAAREAPDGAGPHGLRRLTVETALVLGPSPRALSVVLSESAVGRAACLIASRPEGDAASPWDTHVSATLVGAARRTDAGSPEVPDATPWSTDAAYNRLAEHGLVYGPAYRRLASPCLSVARARARSALTTPLRAGYEAFPTTLDAGLQLFALLAMADDPSDRAYLPVYFEALDILGDLALATSVEATITRRTAGELTGDLVFRAPDAAILAEARGVRFTRVKRDVGARLADLLWAVTWQPAELTLRPATPGRALLFSPRADLGRALASRLTARGYSVEVHATDEPAAASPSAPSRSKPFDIVIHAGALDPAAADADPIAAERTRGLSVLGLLREAARAEGGPRTVILTRGGAPVRGSPVDPSAAAIFGLVRSFVLEGAALPVTLVDVGEASDTELDLAVQIITSEGISADEIALRGREILIPRLERTSFESSVFAEPTTGPRVLRVGRRGSLDGLTVVPFQPAAARAGEVLVEVRAAGLNFRDVLKTLGAYPDPQGRSPGIGDECAGTVCAVGDGVEGLAPGDEVIAIVQHGFSTHALADARLVVRKPAALSFAEGAAMPVAYATAYHALFDVAHIAAGERVLIHAGAGGVGLAAVHLALSRGAIVLATAGSEEKRALLRTLGVALVSDSRSDAFVDDVMTFTRGEGVDVVLNSLAGELFDRSLSILGPGGRFIELGKRDLIANRPLGLRPLAQNCAFFAVDLEELWQRRPARIRIVLEALCALFEQGTLPGPRTTCFDLGSAQAAFRTMAEAHHTGKIVIVPEPASGADTSRERGGFGTRCRPDRAYVVTGGLGAIGVRIATWLVANGARKLALVGRRGVPDADTRQIIDELALQGAEVSIFPADVGDADQVEDFLAAVRAKLGRIAGVIHAAGVVADAMVGEMSDARYLEGFRAKVVGAHALDRRTRGDDLELFVVVSSMTATIGSPGQANYAAANAYLDGLCARRRSEGLPASSVAYGPWSRVGLAAAQENRAKRLAARGLGSLTPELAIAGLDRVVASGVAHGLVLDFDATRWADFYPSARNAARLAGSLDAGNAAADAPEKQSFRDRLAALPADARIPAVEAEVAAQVGRVLKLSVGRIGRVTPLKSLGIDSLLSLELRNCLEVTLGLSLSAAVLFSHPDVESLARLFLDRLGLAEAKVIAPATEEAPSAADEVNAMSNDEAEAELLRELEEIGR